MQPSSLPSLGGRAKVTAVSAEVAASMLAARFAAPGSTGVRDMVQHLQQAAAEEPAAPPAAAGDDAKGAALAAGRQGEELASALASLPERAAAVEQPQLSPDAYVPSVAQQLLSSAAEQQEAVATEQRPEQAAAAPITFAADVLARFCRRGHARHVAAVLLGHCDVPAAVQAAASQVLAALPDSAALDKLLAAVLQEAAAAGSGAAAPGTAPVPLDASPAADPAGSGTAAALARLVPPAVWRARADARLALTDKLLVQQQRRLPPLSALRGLLLFLRRQADVPGGSGEAGASEAGSSGGGGGAASSNNSLLADAAARVAQLWGDASAVQRLAPQQQAYLTAALCGSLALLSRQELEWHPQLLALLLSGITTRLDSPLQVCSKQGLRLLRGASPCPQWGMHVARLLQHVSGHCVCSAPPAHAAYACLRRFPPSPPPPLPRSRCGARRCGWGRRCLRC